jgi:hypothetical protein
MSEKRPGFNPEQGAPETKLLDDEQMAEIEKYAERLFSAYFSSVETDLNSKINRQIKQERYNQLISVLDRGFNFLTEEEKKGIKERIAEKIKLNEVVSEKIVDDDKKVETKNDEQVTPVSEAEMKFELNSDQLFDAIKLRSGSMVSNQEILKNLLSNLKSLYRGFIDKDIKFTYFFEEDFTSTSGLEKRYIFFLRTKLSNGKRETTVKCSLNFTPVKKGVPGKQTTELMPKFFLISVKK